MEKPRTEAPELLQPEQVTRANIMAYMDERIAVINGRNPRYRAYRYARELVETVALALSTSQTILEEPNPQQNVLSALYERLVAKRRNAKFQELLTTSMRQVLAHFAYFLQREPFLGKTPPYGFASKAQLLQALEQAITPESMVLEVPNDQTFHIPQSFLLAAFGSMEKAQEYFLAAYLTSLIKMYRATKDTMKSTLKPMSEQDRLEAVLGPVFFKLTTSPERLEEAIGEIAEIRLDNPYIDSRLVMGFIKELRQDKATLEPKPKINRLTAWLNAKAGK